MIINLCYKQYQGKLNLRAMDYYDQATGRDLWNDLLKFIDAYQKLSGGTVIELITGLHDVVSFKSASYIFHSLIKEEDSSRSLQEIQDAMFAVGWLPSKEDDFMAEPWPLVMYKLALDCNEEFRQLAQKKKSAALEQ